MRIAMYSILILARPVSACDARCAQLCCPALRLVHANTILSTCLILAYIYGFSVLNPCLSRSLRYLGSQVIPIFN
ncbi:hypothetical protein BDV98DRAFT_570146 [Pterulicium gracile]|uniref:Hydrophobin n=1 Tax=Pterulicium gracile TaxID=1884261 RepID=A0A5C3QIA6_9AGAR|nr:hypothetical protein BDV98DRAFT_570146 [Pterula gracilis]